MNLLLLLLLHIITCCNGQAPVHPVSINTTEGTTVEFLCLANNNPTSLIFLVDGSATGVDPNKGFDEQPVVSIGSNTISRSLLVTASVADNDNSMIRCQAINADLMGANSNTAIPRVQGPFSSVVDLSYSFISCYSINISWSPPFTLPGTDITGYNISATSNGTTTNYFTSNSYYELSLTDPFNEIVVNISGYNGLDGEATTLDTIIPPARKLSLSLDIIIDHTLNISLNFTVVTTSGICPYQYPTSLQYHLFRGDHLISINTLSYADVVNIECPLNIIRGQVYSIIVSFTNGLAPELYQYNNISSTFDTYSLVSVRVLNSSDSRVCLECSFSSFSTDNAGCTVELVSSTNSSTANYTRTFSKPSADTICVEGCIIIIPVLTSTELFYITIYDQQEATPREFIHFSCLIEPISPTDTTPSVVNITSGNDTYISTTQSSTPTDPSGTVFPGKNNSSDNTIIIVVSVVILIVILLILTIVIAVIVYFHCMKKTEKEARQSADVPVDSNPAYTSILMGRQPCNTDRSIPTEHNPAYEQVTATNKSHYENITDF